MSSYDVGDVAVLAATVEDGAGALVNPATATFVASDPSGNLTTYVYGTDAELERPSVGSFRVALALTEAGRWAYRFVFTDPQIVEGDAFDVASLIVPARPSVGEVGTLLRARTVDANNNFLGTFTDATTPTGDQVKELIADAVRDVRRDTGLDPEALNEDAAASFRGLAKYRTAMLVELNYPEQSSSDDSGYEKWKMLYDEGVKRQNDASRDDPGDLQGYGSVGVASPTRTAINTGVDPWPDVTAWGWW